MTAGSAPPSRQFARPSGDTASSVSVAERHDDPTREGTDVKAVGRSRRIGRHAGRASLLFLALGTAWSTAHALGLLGSLANSTFNVLAVATVLAAMLGIYWFRPTLRWPWFCIAAGLILFAVGGIARTKLATFGNLTTSRSLIPDLITLPGYFLYAIGLTGLARMRRRGQEGNFEALLDCGIAALAALALAWVYLIVPTLSHAHAPITVRLLLSCYPAMSVFLLAITARLAFSPANRRVPAFRYLLISLVLVLVGDTIYMMLETGSVTIPPVFVDLPYAFAYVMMGACLLHPSMRELSDPVPFDEKAPTPSRLVFVAVALAIPAVLTVSRGGGSTSDRVVLGVIIAALTGTAIWRMSRALRDNAQSVERLAHQATHDALTGLPNRVVAQEHVTQALRTSRGRHVAVVFLDVDRFKLVNDTVGHSLGDELLAVVAARLRGAVRDGDLVARTGGDEFVIVLEQVDDIGHAMELAERTRKCFDTPFIIRGAEIYASASLGLSFSDGSDPATDFETMLRDADIAMYKAKDAGRDGIAVFDESLRDRAGQQLTLGQDLHGALERGEMEVHFQPVVALPAGPALGLEALLRWSHPKLGQVPPATFVPIAEESGLIVEIGGWVLNEACRQVAGWRRNVVGASELYVCVNLSARQLRDQHLVDRVHASLAQFDLPPDALCIELTESILMENVGEAELFNELRNIGVRLSIDDFGTGYSSLAYLKRFPLDYVKIDRAFVEGLDRVDTSDESLVAAIVAMAAALGMTTIGEGVETAAQERRLIKLGCNAAQGYRYSRPVAAAQVPESLRRALKQLGSSLKVA